MTRRGYLGVAAVCAIAAAAAAVWVGQVGLSAAESSPAVTATASVPVLGTPARVTQRNGRDVLFHAEVTPDGGAGLWADAPGVRVEKTVTGTNLQIVLSSDSDQVIVKAAQAGAVTVTRGGQSKTISPAAFTKKALLEVRTLLTGSDAVSAFRLLVTNLEAEEQDQAGESLIATGALVGLLDGDLQAPSRVIQRIARHRAIRLRHVAAQKTSGDCWDAYAREADRIYQNALDCQDQTRWNPLSHAGCSLEFGLRAEFNFLWLLSCNGGLPHGGA
jgi:hypothetical protein